MYCKIRQKVSTEFSSGVRCPSKDRCSFLRLLARALIHLSFIVHDPSQCGIDATLTLCLFDDGPWAGGLVRGHVVDTYFRELLVFLVVL